MKRNLLRCEHCGSQEFEITVNYCIPRAIHIECKCGYITPVAFFDEKGKAYAINGKETLEAYENTFCGEITEKEARESELNDIANNLN